MFERLNSPLLNIEQFEKNTKNGTRKKKHNHNIVCFLFGLIGFDVLWQHLAFDCRQNHANIVKLHMISIKPKGFLSIA